MDASREAVRRRIRFGRSVVTSAGMVIASVALTSSTAGAFSPREIATTSSTKGGVVLLILGGGFLLLGAVGFFVFTWSRRKRRPSECAEQRAALALAERAVRYWEGVRAHLEAVERERTLTDARVDEPSHASLVAKAEEGLSSAMRQRDQCQMELIRCMASGVPMAAVTSQPPLEPQTFPAPGLNGTPPSSPFPTNP